MSDSTSLPPEIRSLLIDLDGTLYIDDQPVEGAVAAVTWLKQQGYLLRFLTNTTTRTRSQIAQNLKTMGFAIEANEIVTAPEAACQFLRNARAVNPSGSSHKIWPVVAEDVKPEFAEFETDEEHPDYIVVGDIGPQWDYELLNRIFNRMLGGASLLALHKNRYWHTANALHVDIGLFIEGLEYATRKQAVIMGKPSPDYFNSTLATLGVSPQQAIVVGDDIESDVGGAQHCGLRGLLVKTGKYRPKIAAESTVRPDATLNSIAVLPAWLQANAGNPLPPRPD